uniref:Multiple coagulation factor deficiency 2-like n=1 Tax=Ixodes scapularis TaxID=6945 RepID=Q4PM98_IXOSC|nr:multiple coagulation factor deficiency 2-like [Ixodes scapularis]
MADFHCHHLALAVSICVLLFGMASLTAAHEHHHYSNTDQLKKKWSAHDVVRDVEHIKQDLAKLIVLQKDGDISDEEIAFYYLRMHDFDNNNLLDGHEIMAAMHHKHEARQGESETVHAHTLDELIEQADSALEDDMNHDGFLSYPEIRAAMNKRR